MAKAAILRRLHQRREHILVLDRDLLMRLDRAQLVRDVEADTIAGLVLQQAEHIPVVGERVGWMGFDMEVVDMDGTRIDKVIIRTAEDS